MRGTELWERAKRLIPGGSQLLSKRAEMFLPGGWPSYYENAKGVEVWDLEGNRFVDMSIMGVGSCVLGYADDDVNGAVVKAVEAGSMCTLNCPEEVELAEVLLELHPWAGMVRYARTGGEAMAVAVRIARAASGKDKVAFCGYHGWHDWYLSANLADDRSLDGHLLPGLKPLGVPRGLAGTAFPFRYNRAEELERLVSEHEIGVIVLEPVRHREPEGGFLEKVREVAKRIGAILVVDEITTGFRAAVGGAHMLYGVEPDIVVYAKAMSNGFPMAAVVGRREVMDVAQDSFISSTYWTERIGPTAALATIRKLVREDVPSHLAEVGRRILQGWERSAQRHGLKVKLFGAVPSLPEFQFDYGEEGQALHTLFTQEMLERGFLASRRVYVSYSHGEEHIEAYLEAVDEVFGLLKEAVETGTVHERLKGPVAHTGFRRLT